jgi:phosphoglycolate phosphatase
VKIKTVIIDLDGPILEGKFRHYQCYSDILIRNGFLPMPMEEYWEMKRNRIDRHTQLSNSGADKIYHIFSKSWVEMIEKKNYLSLDRLQPGAVENLQSLRFSGIRIILITMRNNKDNLKWQLKFLDLLPLFDQVIAVGTAGADRKANAVRSYIDKIPKESCLWIGDTEADINAARLIEVKVCAVSCGVRTHDYLTKLNPDFLVSDLNKFILY